MLLPPPVVVGIPPVAPPPRRPPPPTGGSGRGGSDRRRYTHSGPGWRRPPTSRVVWWRCIALNNTLASTDPSIHTSTLSLSPLPSRHVHPPTHTTTLPPFFPARPSTHPHNHSQGYHLPPAGWPWSRSRSPCRWWSPSGKSRCWGRAHGCAFSSVSRRMNPSIQFVCGRAFLSVSR